MNSRQVSTEVDDGSAEVMADGTKLEREIELAVIVPSFNERENVSAVVSGLKTALTGIQWEVIFVDDNSLDGTADRIREMASTDRRIRVLDRIGRRGLSLA